MHELVREATAAVSLTIDVIALIAVVIGTIEAVWRSLHVMLAPHASNDAKRNVWLQYARWLVIALTFQLASDIIETSVAPTWTDIGQLAVIAIIRTFLNYFLERDIDAAREKQRSGD